MWWGVEGVKLGCDASEQIRPYTHLVLGPFLNKWAERHIFIFPYTDIIILREKEKEKEKERGRGGG